MSVTIKLPKRSMYVGSYLKVPFTIDPASGLGPDDIDFVVDPPEVAIVSIARESDWSINRPYITLLARHRAGRFRLTAVDKQHGQPIASERFGITASWPKTARKGASFWFGGTDDISHPGLGAAWGGGPNGPQNTRSTPVSGTWRIGIVFCDTADGRYPTATADRDVIRDLWLDHVTNGVLDNNETRSVRAYIEEVSYGNLTLSAVSLGFVSLPGAWSSYFDTSGWMMGTLPTAVVAAADSTVDFSAYDTIIVVTPRNAAAQLAAWPVASIGKWGPYATADGSFRMGWISCVADWGQAAGNVREIFETISHELCHNLGLLDQYAPTVGVRNAGTWELMDDEDPHPHPTVAHRMVLGWVRPEWVETFDFQSTPAPVDRHVTLQRIESGQPTGSNKTAIEVRIADGVNYYWEYRSHQAGQIGDEHLPADSRVLGTDFVGDPGLAPISRPNVLLLPDHPNDDGPVLGDGQSFRDTDYSTPGFPQDFVVDVSNINGTTADLRVRYGVNGRPDPSIRPWPAGPDRPWQSPDIEVRNARSAAKSEWTNVPWAGHDNQVIAHIRNSGTVTAPDVVVNFYVKNYTLSNANETFIGSDTHTIPPGQTVEFSTTWVAPAGGHHCVIVRIPLYVVPGSPTIVEMTELNNQAQSNYDRFIPTTASPSTREGTVVEVTNPFDQPTVVFINGSQTNEVYRVLVGHRWLALRANETVKVPVWFEYAPTPGDDRVPVDLKHLSPKVISKLTRVPNRVGLWAWAYDPDDDPRHSFQLTGGAMAEVQVGRKTRIEFDEVGDSSVRGHVVTEPDSKPVTGGSVIVTLDPSGERADPTRYGYATAKVRPDGRFGLEFGPKWRLMWADYLPTVGFGPATSRDVRR